MEEVSSPAIEDLAIGYAIGPIGIVGLAIGTIVIGILSQ